MKGLAARGQGIGTARWRLVGAALVGIVLLAVGRAALADGGVFATTPHGNPATGIERLTGPDYPRGSCVQCHYQHASAEGSATGTPNPYALFAPNDNNLCGAASCHDSASADRVYPGLTSFTQSAHATNSAVIWPGPTPWARRTSDAGKCINCHDPHGYTDTQGLIPSLGLAREETSCLACHDGSPAHTNISFELSKTYSHPVTSVSGRHTANEGSDAAKVGSANRHSECEDCHNVHTLQHPVAPPTAPNASSRLLGSPYLEVTNGAAWTPPAYVYHGPDDATPIQYEYQLCFRCHSSWTTLPLTSPSGRAPTDKARELNPNNPSYHPVEAAGKQTALTWPANGLLAPLTTTSQLSCSDCHASDSPTAPAGPHGSTYRYVLKRNYRTDEHSTTYTATDYALCFGCHRETAVMDDTGTAGSTNFQYHKLHLTGASGTQLSNPTCASCHGNTHGSDKPRLIDFAQETHLTSFVSWTSKQDGAGTGSCTLTCHGHQHTGVTY